MNFAYKNNYPYVLQNETSDIQARELFDNQAKLNPDLLSILLKSWHINQQETDKFLRYFSKYTKVFFNTDQWFHFIKEFDFVFGSRFHGAVAGLTNGVPAFLITHDTRTDELAKLFKIPHKRINELGNFSFDEIVKKADFTDYEKTYETLYKNYVFF